jgi:15-cis-phytoene desaturase
MSAAHELVERGFTVDVYEARDVQGGKARSIPVPSTGTEGRPNLPGEHGFRFFPGFYKHLPDTMKRIPFPGNAQGVFDNLVQGTRFMLARGGVADPVLVARWPTSLSEWKDAFVAFFNASFGVSLSEACFFAERLLVVLTSSEERRLGEWELVPWWDFIKAEQFSDAYRELLAKGLTRSLVAMRAEEGSTRTVATILLQLLFNLITPGGTLDRVLNGPTSEVWLDPWLAHLQAKGVGYHFGSEVTALQLVDGMIAGATVGGVNVTADYYVLALPAEKVIPLIDPALSAAAPSLNGVSSLRYEWMSGIQFFLRHAVPLAHGHVVYADTPWALTSISQEQFWRRPISDYGDGTANGILSVDISDWETPGILYGKAAKDLTEREQVHAEVWAQLKSSLDGVTPNPIGDANLLTWFLDNDIVLPNPTGTTNLEPLLVNVIDSWRSRPEAWTEIPNLFLAADYVRTHTDLACMEAANEAARRAVNGIIKRSSAAVSRCEVWPLKEPFVFAPFKAIDRLRYGAGLPHILNPSYVTASAA